MLRGNTICSAFVTIKPILMRDFLFLKTNSKFVRIFFKDLIFVEASDKYVRFVTVNKTYMVLGCLMNTENRLPADQFCRIHRSYIVSLRHIDEFTSETVSMAGNTLPLARQYKPVFFEKAEILCADKSEPAFKVYGDSGKNIPAK